MVDAEYDILRIVEDGTPLWVDTAIDEADARKKLTELRAKNDGFRYFAFHFKTGQEFLFDDNQGEPPRLF